MSAILKSATITKQIVNLEVKIMKLGKQLHKTNSTQVEMELYKTKEILFHLEKIEALLNN